MHKQFFIAAWKECRQQPRSFITDPDSPALAASGGRRIAKPIRKRRTLPAALISLA